jgi:hypothetical protein
MGTAFFGSRGLNRNPAANTRFCEGTESPLPDEEGFLVVPNAYRQKPVPLRNQ